MEPIFNLPPDLPGHRDVPVEPVEAEIVCEWPKGTFVENLAVLANGLLAVSVHSEQVVEGVDGDGHRTVLTKLAAPPTGLVACADGGFYVASGEPGTAPGRVWRVDANGLADLAFTLEDAVFLNGLTPLSETTLLTVDSVLGRIYVLDLSTGESSVWYEGDLLRKITSFAFMPGGNGLKVFAGAVYLTNTDRATVVRVAVEPDGSAGAAEILADGLRGDDLAFDVEGNAYLATHIENTVVRLSPTRERLAIAGPAQWMAGCTAVAFGRAAADRKSVYVTTTGGLVRPYENELATPKLVRLHIDVEGVSLPLAI